MGREPAATATAAPPAAPSVETKAYDFLADTQMRETDRRATARDLARLCKEGRIKGC